MNITFEERQLMSLYNTGVFLFKKDCEKGQLLHI